MKIHQVQYSNNNIVEQDEPLSNKDKLDEPFIEYLDTIFNTDAFAKKNRKDEMCEYVVRFIEEVATIADTLRNPAAHREKMSYKKAEVCGNYLIKSKKFILKFINKLKFDK